MTWKMICGDHTLYGLDDNGQVFKYIPANKDKDQYAFWVALTHRKKDNTGPRCGVTRTDDTHVLYCILMKDHDQAHEWVQREMFRDNATTNKTCPKVEGSCMLLVGHQGNCVVEKLS
jgi:hypothetical protein